MANAKVLESRDVTRWARGLPPDPISFPQTKLTCSGLTWVTPMQQSQVFSDSPQLVLVGRGGVRVSLPLHLLVATCPLLLQVLEGDCLCSTPVLLHLPSASEECLTCVKELLLEGQTRGIRDIGRVGLVLTEVQEILTSLGVSREVRGKINLDIVSKKVYNNVNEKIVQMDPYDLKFPINDLKKEQDIPDEDSSVSCPCVMKEEFMIGGEESGNSSDSNTEEVRIVEEESFNSSVIDIKEEVEIVNEESGNSFTSGEEAGAVGINEGSKLIREESENSFTSDAKHELDIAGKEVVIGNSSVTETTSFKAVECGVVLERLNWNRLTYFLHEHHKLLANGMRSRNCGECRNCLTNIVQGSCGHCVFCIDTISGRRRLKQKCSTKKRCVAKYFSKCLQCMQLRNI